MIDLSKTELALLSGRFEVTELPFRSVAGRYFGYRIENVSRCLLRSVSNSKVIYCLGVLSSKTFEVHPNLVAFSQFVESQ